MLEITDQEFAHFQRFIFDAAGITLAASKKILVTSRLSSRCSTRQWLSVQSIIGAILNLWLRKFIPLVYFEFAGNPTAPFSLFLKLHDQVRLPDHL